MRGNSHDASAGSLKITPTIAWTTSMLAWGMLNFPEGYNKSNAWETGMQTLKWNTDYLLKTIKDDPTDSATSEAEEFYIIYQVCISSYALCACKYDACSYCFINDVGCNRCPHVA